MNTYDHIISLGGFCGAASQLRARGLRSVAFPFDWLYMEDESTIRWLTRAFSTNFDDFCLKQNLVAITRPGIGGMAKFKYRDTASGYGFIHHFHKSIDDGGYEAVYAVFKRRIERMLRVFAPQKSILLILSTTFDFHPQLAEDLILAIRSRYPTTRIDLYVMQFGATFEASNVIAEAITGNYSFTGARYARRHGDYDNSRTSYEWSFLDNVSLNGKPLLKPNGIAKIRFKIWKSLSKWLRDHGYGCLGVRFHG